MKIALCLSGQPRGLPLSLKMLKANLVGIEDMDIFLHAWFDPNTIGQPYDSAQAHQQGRVGLVHPQTEEMLLSLNPKDYIWIIWNNHEHISSPRISFRGFVMTKTFIKVDIR